MPRLAALVLAPFLLADCGGKSQAPGEGVPGTGASAGTGSNGADNNGGGTVGGGTAATNSSVSEASAGLEELSCPDLEALLRQRLESGFAHGDQSCASDDDCVFTSPDFGCYHGCTGWLVGRRERSATESAVQRAVAPLCSALGGRCPLAQPSCPPGPFRTGECAEGTCRIFDGASLSCQELAAEALSLRTSLVEAADRSCTQDSDCVMFFEGPGCAPDCQLYRSVAARAQSALQQAVWRVGSKYCNAYYERPCPEPTALSCPDLPGGEPHAGCVAALCEVRYGAAPEAGL